MATRQADVAPEVFLEALAWPAPGAAPDAAAATPAGTVPATLTAAEGTLAAAPAPAPAATARRHRRTTWLLTTAALVVVTAGTLVGHALLPGPAAPEATVSALDVPQRPGDVLSDDDVARLVVRPDSTRLLVATAAGAHYAALSASGELCLVRVPVGDLPSAVCVPDRAGADATIGAPGDGEGQVRLVADGAPQPATADGWRLAGPNVWVRG